MFVHPVGGGDAGEGLAVNLGEAVGPPQAGERGEDEGEGDEGLCPATAVCPPPQLPQQPCAQDKQGGVDGQEIAHRFDPAGGDEEEVDPHPTDQDGVLPPIGSAAQDAPQCPAKAQPCGDARQHAHPVQNHVGQGEDDGGAVYPLQGRWETRFGGLQALDFFEVGAKTGVEADEAVGGFIQPTWLLACFGHVCFAGDGAVGEGVGLGEAEDDEGDEGGHHATQDDVLQGDAPRGTLQVGPPFAFPRFALRQPDETRYTSHACQRGDVDAGGEGEAEQYPKECPPAFAGGLFAGAHGRVNGHGGQPGRPVVHCVKVGLLDGHDGRGHEEGGQQADAVAVEAMAY